MARRWLQRELSLRARAVADDGSADAARLAGALLIVAGLYQLTPIKRACLQRLPVTGGFLVTHWRAGRAGAFRLGLIHGWYCLGCCWALMLLLFAARRDEPAR